MEARRGTEIEGVEKETRKGGGNSIELIRPKGLNKTINAQFIPNIQYSIYLISVPFLAVLCSSLCALSQHQVSEYPHTQGSPLR